MDFGKDPLSGILIFVLGVLTLGTAVYFLALRPPLLPEDIRYSGIDIATLPPAFLVWLGVVFRSWGGFIAGFGIVLLGIGTFMLTGRTRWLSWATAAGVVVAFGRFVYGNLVLSSDFLWFIAVPFFLAVGAALSLLLRCGR
ncbi:MAG: hypothetical protein KGZ91_10545 [Afipia sp.]|nr:hypothetical protein [Afipia sp.]